MLSDFIKYIQESKSRNTLKTYVSALTPFDNWLRSRNSSIEQTKTEDVSKYLSDRNDWSMTTGITFLQAFKSYIKYCLAHQNIGVTSDEIRLNLLEQQRLNQLRNYQYPRTLAQGKKPKKRVLSMSIDDLNKFFSIADRRDKIYAYLLLNFCLRKNELLEVDGTKNLKVYFKNSTATFGVLKHMGTYLKTLPFDGTARKVLEEFLKLPKEVDSGAINRRLSRYDKRMGYRIYPHLFRHTAITEMFSVLPSIYPAEQAKFLIRHIAGHKQEKGDMTAYYTDPKKFEQELRECLTVNNWLRRVNIRW
jgi:integrase